MSCAGIFNRVQNADRTTDTVHVMANKDRNRGRPAPHHIVDEQTRVNDHQDTNLQATYNYA